MVCASGCIALIVQDDLLRFEGMLITLNPGASASLSADAKFGGPLHMEALPDQQQVQVSPELLLYLAHHAC